jgi:hypothetical protein
MLEQTRSDGDLGVRLARLAQDDAAFRERLLADPKAAVKQELDRAILPEGQSPINQQGAQSPYLVLPLTPSGPAERRPAAQQLTDADFEDCAGYPPPCFDCIGQGCFD